MVKVFLKFSIVIFFLLVTVQGCVTENPNTVPTGKDLTKGLWSLGEPTQLKTNYVLPSAVSLCGEVIPLDRPAVRERLDYEFLLAINHTAQVELWRRRALRYFPLIESALKKAGLPDDLKYLAVAESDLRPTITSPAGAKGLWQFMPGTARLFGLTVDKNQDQRALPEPLLNAGMKYLATLHDRFGNWAMAMAAYNCGEGRIARALSGQPNDYYLLNLPRETERYVYRIAAIKIILTQNSQYGFNATTPKGLYQPVEFDETSVTFKQSLSWVDLAKKCGTDYKTLKSLNPHLAAKPTLTGGPFQLRTPKGLIPDLAS